LLTINPGIEPVNANMSPIGPLCANDSPVAIFAEDLGALSGVGVSGGSFNPGISGPGTFEITNTIVDVCGGDFATLNVIVHPIPFVQFEANKLEGCRPLAVSFLNTGDSGVDYSWGFGDGTILNSLEAVTHTYVNAGIYNVDLTISDANACQMTESYYGYIEVYELPIANFKYAPLEVTTIDLQVDFLDLSFGSESYYWSFDILQNSTVQNPSFTFPDREGTYQIEQVVISEHGCKDTIVKTIIVEQAHLIFIPNVIIPSADNNGNATFLPYMQGIDLDSYHLSIFNRWGELIFGSYDLSKGWNGNYGDQGIVQDGVYIWKITAKDQDSDKVRAYQGHITVLR
jgi:gliding motility-associated-like protein